jgi:hypothetical protein
MATTKSTKEKKANRKEEEVEDGCDFSFICTLRRSCFFRSSMRAVTSGEGLVFTFPLATESDAARGLLATPLTSEETNEGALNISLCFLLFFFAFSFWNNSSLQNAKETMGVGWL